MDSTFTWATKFKSIIIVDNELFQNEYDVQLEIKPTTSNLKTQSAYFERLKLLFENVFHNTITSYRSDPLYQILRKSTMNRFIELPKPPYDQVMASVCFCKANAILDGKIHVKSLTLGSFQGDGIKYKVDKNAKELTLLDVNEWFSEKYKKFDPWWLRPDTATYDNEMSKGIYTGHFSWQEEKKVVDKKHEDHAKIFEFNPRVLDGGKNKNK
ncbi:MAG: hypothetical protein CMM91_09650 [Rickettsiales bacterium]|jgi:hypothetical protein|nr:hypothetical protein [Rickettsiales bacterium]|tara:strand:- start:1849 stop:2484 length:636 start_codon:yes stop_codon:yes gene_type:complete